MYDKGLHAEQAAALNKKTQMKTLESSQTHVLGWSFQELTAHCMIKPVFCVTTVSLVLQAFSLFAQLLAHSPKFKIRRCDCCQDTQHTI